MDPLTHSLTGALIGQAGLKRRTGLAMSALIVGANLPDIDAACLLWLDGVQHLGFRRGITHGPIAWVLLPLLLAGALWRFDRWQTRRGQRPEGRMPVHFGWLYGLSFIACLTHPALDWLNVYGVRWLEPFSSRWFYGDTLFIVDVWLWLGMGFATWLSLRREKRGGKWRRPALVGLVGTLVYINLNLLITRIAVVDAFGEDGVNIIASPPPLAFWRREIISYTRGFPESDDVALGEWDLFGQQPISFEPIGTEDHLLVCADLERLATDDPGLSAFLFWSRVPFTDRRADGAHVLADARYYDPLARNRFSVRYEPVDCYEHG